MPEPDFLIGTAADGRDLLAAAEMDWSRPIPHCPEWNAGELVGHVGGILAWIARIVTTAERVSRREREVAPADRGALEGWYSAHLDRTLDILRCTDPDTETWTFSSRGDRRVGWWRRRLAVELAIHRWDAQYAAGLDGGPPPRPLDGEVAAAGIEEFLIEFLPGLLAGDGVKELAGTLQLHATDGPSAWWIDLDARSDAVAGSRDTEADTVVRGTRSDLLLWLTNRGLSGTLKVLGRPEISRQWPQLRR
jgi:uncharacterized protein (TIGR03083 family)